MLQPASFTNKASDAECPECGAECEACEDDYGCYVTCLECDYHWSATRDVP